MRNWKEMVNKSPQVRGNTGKSKSKFVPKRDTTIVTQQKSFIKYKDEKSFSQNNTKIDPELGGLTLRSDVSKPSAEIRRVDSIPSLDIPLEKGMSPSRSATIDPYPGNKQREESWLSKKNEMEIMKLKREFLEFQRKVMTELKRQQEYIDELVMKIQQQIQKSSLMIRNQKVEENIIIPPLSVKAQNKFINGSEFDSPIKKTLSSPINAGTLKQAPLIKATSHIKQKSIIHHEQIKSSPKASSSLNFTRFLSAINNLKKQMKQISDLSEIETLDSRISK